MKNSLIGFVSSALYSATIGLVVTPLSVTAATLDAAGDGLIAAGNGCKKAAGKVDATANTVKTSAQLRREKSQLKAQLLKCGIPLPAAAWSGEHYEKLRQAIESQVGSIKDFVAMDTALAGEVVLKACAQLAFTAAPQEFTSVMNPLARQTQEEEREVFHVGGFVEMPPVPTT